MFKVGMGSKALGILVGIGAVLELFCLIMFYLVARNIIP
jgi:hypothetical protein